MKYWTMCYPGEVGQLVRETFSEEQILASYYAYWKERMMEIGKANEVTEAACIEDWKTVHWAWETDERGEAIDKRND